VSMNFAIFYKENDKLKIVFLDSLQDTEVLISKLKSQNLKCYFVEFDYEQLVHLSCDVRLVDRIEYDYTRNLFD